MSFLIGVLIFVVALLVSVMLHEAGHFVTAKAFGMKATQFFVGFGTTLWSTRRGETEYGVKALPVGGFVKITGMTILDDVDPADEPRSFRAKPGWQRSIVLASGSFMHFTIAFVLLFILAVGVGVADQSGATVTVLTCVPATRTVKLRARRPALARGHGRVAVRRQDRRGRRAASAQLEADRQRDPGAPGGQLGTVHDRPRQPRDHQAGDPGEREAGGQGAFLGVSPIVIYNRNNPIKGVSYAGSQFGTIAAQSVTALGRIPKAIPYLFSKDRAATPGGQVSSMVGAANITGDVVAANIGWQQKISVVLLIVIEVNIFVGIFNLAAAAAAGRRPPGRRDIRARPRLDSQAVPAARPWPGRHQAAHSGERRGVRPDRGVRLAADRGRHHQPAVPDPLTMTRQSRRTRRGVR